LSRIDTQEAGVITADQMRSKARELVEATRGADRREFLGARYDAGLAWVNFPVGFGGLGAPRSLQSVLEEALVELGAPESAAMQNVIGYGMAAPTILAHGTDEQRTRLLRPLWTGEHIWCQLFSEPGAGSDLAAAATRAVRDGAGADAEWIVDGQKVWTSFAHVADYGLLLARTDPSVPKHRGMTYFVMDMHAPGVDVRPLRQLTGQAEFNEVFMSGVRIPDELRLGAVGEGWTVAQSTLMSERVAIGGGALPREAGLIGAATRAWRERPELRTPGLHERLLRLWVETEANRLNGERMRQRLAAGSPGPEGSAAKLSYARLNQAVTGLNVELLGEDGLAYDDWEMRRVRRAGWPERGAGFRYLRMKGNSIEGGTSEVLRNIISERVLGLPREPRTDTGVAWKDLPK
jgi:alkylation response protein AidB-like acyl-CoA dehydrogenase